MEEVVDGIGPVAPGTIAFFRSSVILSLYASLRFWISPAPLLLAGEKLLAKLRSISMEFQIYSFAFCSSFDRYLSVMRS